MSKSTSVSFSAKFDVTITIPIGVWGDDTNLRDMREQLTREATAKLVSDLKGISYVVHKSRLTGILGIEE